jgi:D-inositol-3-phosphate glycosyltransferase
VGQGVTNTGYSRVLHSILAHLHQRYEIHHFALNYQGAKIEAPWQIYPNELRADKFGREQLRPLIERIRPQLAFLLEDVWFFPLHLKILAQFQDELKVILYCPIEDGSLAPTILESINTADRVIAYTQCGKAILENTCNWMKREQSDFRFPLIEDIPHGVDTSRFYPLQEISGTFENGANRRLARKLLFGEAQEDPNGFIVLNANRHRPRKRLDITVRGFALFAADKPKNVKLYLHTGVEEFSPSLVALARQYGVAERLLPHHLSIDHPLASDQQLNLIYNACDVGINTAKSEAWGLVSFEHAATGAAQIVPGHGVYQELWEGAAMMLETVEYRNKEKNLTERHVTPESVADVLERLYRDRNLLRQMSATAYAHAARREYAWSSIAERWNQLFCSLLREEGKPT